MGLLRSRHATTLFISPPAPRARSCRRGNDREGRACGDAPPLRRASEHGAPTIWNAVERASRNRARERWSTDPSAFPRLPRFPPNSPPRVRPHRRTRGRSHSTLEPATEPAQEPATEPATEPASGLASIEPVVEPGARTRRVCERAATLLGTPNAGLFGAGAIGRVFSANTRPEPLYNGVRGLDSFFFTRSWRPSAALRMVGDPSIAGCDSHRHSEARSRQSRRVPRGAVTTRLPAPGASVSLRRRGHAPVGVPDAFGARRWP